MLKLIPPFREQDERLLTCATNSVRALDSALSRHGRFDYVIPVGPPDPAAREAIWDRYLAAMPRGVVAGWLGDAVESQGMMDGRDLAALVVPTAGEMIATGDRYEPCRLAGPDGAAAEPVTEFFRDLLAAGRAEATVRSYGMDLLRWFRFICAAGIGWDRADQQVARDFSRWLQVSARGGRGYAAAVRAHSETVLRAFYGYHLGWPTRAARPRTAEGTPNARSACRDARQSRAPGRATAWQPGSRARIPGPRDAALDRPGSREGRRAGRGPLAPPGR